MTTKITRRIVILTVAPSLGLVLSLGLGACTKGSGPTTEPTNPDSATAPPHGEGEPSADPLAGRPVVKNVDAQPGDVTTCPYSGRTFEVKADLPQVEHGGKTYWICSEKAAEAVRAEPSKYLDGFEG
jgi:YHS domain-containing protein